MLTHAPLSVSAPIEYRSNLDDQSSFDSKLLACGISPPFLSQASPFPLAQTVLGSLSTQTGATVELPSTCNSSLVGTSDVTNNSLSGSSSLSSSLASLHSAHPNIGKLPNVPSPLGQQRSISRSSVWLKLRVCPIWLASHLTQVPNLFSGGLPSVATSTTTGDGDNNTNSTSNQSAICPDLNADSHLCDPSTCPYAHPSSNVRVEAGHVTICYDFIKRKNCKHTACKYYHPLPHQIDDILKRGDEQKKLMEKQQRLLDSKLSAYLSMQPSQSPGSTGGLSAAICGSGLNWPSIPVSLYGAYAQSLPTTLNPMAAIPSHYTSTTESNNLNPSALLAAAAVLQQQQQNQNLLQSSASKSSLVNGLSSSGITQSTDSGQYNTVAARASVVNEHSQIVVPAVSHALGLLNSLSSTYGATFVASGLGAAASPSQASSTDCLSTAIASLASSVAQFDLPASITPSSTSNASVTSTSTTAVTVSPAASAPVARAGMKRDANSSSSDACGTLHSWYSSKRANLSTNDGAQVKAEPTEYSDPLYPSNGVKSDEGKCEAELGSGTPDALTALPTGLMLSSPYCGAVPSQGLPPGFSNLINPVNLYGLAYPAQPASSYIQAQHFPYGSVYAPQGTADVSNPAASFAFNNWLNQQQQQQQSQVPQQLLQLQTPLFQAPNSNPAMTALAGLQQHQGANASPDLSGATQSLAFPNQQAALLSLILKAQQSQLAAAQMTAAAQCSGAAGLLPPGAYPRPVAALANPYLFDPTYSFPANLTGLCPAALLPTACIQNPITNVTYINEKGQLLESLPICRDFKAGKCHRNGECRYVHLVDENVEINQGRVIVCRDAAKGRCTRVPCKYYHVPLLAISANRSIALNSALATVGAPNNQGV